MTLAPLTVFGIIILSTYLLLGYKAALFIVSMSIGGFIGGGKLVILAGAIHSAPIGVWPLAGMVVLGDLATGMIIIANMHHLYNIPSVGRYLAAAREAGYRVLAKHKWMKRMTIAGLTLFVGAPFQGTGAVLGVILGRILGLARTTILSAIFVGSAMGSLLMATIGLAGGDRITMLAENPLLGIISVAVSLTAAFLLGRWFLGQAGENQS